MQFRTLSKRTLWILLILALIGWCSASGAASSQYICKRIWASDSIWIPSIDKVTDGWSGLLAKSLIFDRAHGDVQFDRVMRGEKLSGEDIIYRFYRSDNSLSISIERNSGVFEHIEAHYQCRKRY